jgi:hypothetical protein
VADRVDVLASTERLVEPVHTGGQRQQRLAGRVEARRVVVRHLERHARCRRELELVLQRDDRSDVVGITGVGEDAHGDEHVRRLELVDAHVVDAGIVVDAIDVMVLVDDHHRHVPVTVLRHGHGRAAGDVEDPEAVQRVAVQSDHRLVLHVGGFTVVHDAIDPARGALEIGEHAVRLGSSEVVDVDLDRHG